MHFIHIYTHLYTLIHIYTHFIHLIHLIFESKCKIVIFEFLIFLKTTIFELKNNRCTEVHGQAQSVGKTGKAQGPREIQEMWHQPRKTVFLHFAYIMSIN